MSSSKMNLHPLEKVKLYKQYNQNAHISTEICYNMTTTYVKELQT